MSSLPICNVPSRVPLKLWVVVGSSGCSEPRTNRRRQPGGSSGTQHDLTSPSSLRYRLLRCTYEVPQNHWAPVPSKLAVYCSLLLRPDRRLKENAAFYLRWCPGCSGSLKMRCSIRNARASICNRRGVSHRLDLARADNWTPSTKRKLGGRISGHSLRTTSSGKSTLRSPREVYG